MPKKESETKAHIQEPIDLKLKPHSHQPSKAEQEEEIDMPGWSLDRVRETFLRPFVVKAAK